MTFPQKRMPRNERIRRAVKRKNKKVIAQNPLLASELREGGLLAHWLTDEAEESARYERIEERLAGYTNPHAGAC